jgi:predicted  nucleic acid-binding Zn-ribbon protein
MPAAERLFALQQLDTRSERLREEMVPLRRVLEGDPAATDPRPALDRLRAERAALVARIRAAEREEETELARARSHERQLMGGTIHNPKELSKLSEELQHLRARIAVQDSSLFEMLETQEELEKQVVNAEAQAVADAEALRRREAELESVAAQRAALRAELGEEYRRLYDRVAALRKPAVVEVRGGACTGCRLPIAPTRLKLLRGEEPIVCEACNRILYLA